MGESPPLLHGLRNGGTDMAKKRFQHMKEMVISAHGNIMEYYLPSGKLTVCELENP